MTAQALRWVPGKGTCLVPCTVLSVEGRRTVVRFEDGTTTRTCTEYVLTEKRA